MAIDLTKTQTISPPRPGEDALRQLTTLYQASLAINRATSEQEVVEALTKQLSFGEFDRGLVVLFREREEPCGEVCGFWDRATKPKQPSQWMSASQFGRATQVFNDIPHNRKIHPESREHFEKLGIQAAATIPLIAQEKPMGALVLEARRPYTFSREDLQSYEALTSQAAAALQNQRLLAAQKRRADELASLVAISRAFSAITDLKETYRALTHRMAEALGVERCLIALYNPTLNEIVGQSPAYNVPDSIAESFRYPAGGAMRDRWNLRQQGTFVTNNPRKDVPPQLHHFVDAFDVQSMLVVPIEAEGQVIGMIYAANKPGGFDEQDTQLSTVFAGQVAAVMRNAQLFEAQQQRAQQLDMLYQVAATTSGSLALDEMLQQTLSQLTSIVNCDGALVTLRDHEHGDLYLAYGTGLPAELEARLKQQGMDGTLCALTAQMGKAHYRPDLSQVTEVDTAGPIQLGLQSYLGVPLLAEGEVLGTLCAFGRSSNQFADASLDLIASIGRQVGLSIRNSLRYEVERQRALQVQTAAEISRAAAGETDQQALLQTAVDLIRYRFGYYHASVFVLDQAGEWAVVKASTGEVGQVMMDTPHKLPVGGQSIVGNAASTGQAHIALDTGKDAVHFDNPLLPRTRSEMGLPLVARGRVLGVLDVQSTEPAAFGENDITILQTMADQIAIALHNAQLLSELEVAANGAEQQANQSAALLRVFQQVQSAPDLKAQIQMITEGVVEAGLFRRAILSVLDDDWQTMQDLSGYAGLSENQIATIADSPPPTREERMARFQEQFRIGNSYHLPAGQDPVTGRSTVPSSIPAEQFKDWHPDDMFIVPLWLGDRLVGVLNLDDPFDGRRPTAELVVPLELFAGLAARVIENSRLLENTGQLYQTLTQLTESKSVSDITGTTVERLRQMVHAEWAILYLVDHSQQRVLQTTESGRRLEGRPPLSYEELQASLGGEAMRVKRPIISASPEDSRGAASARRQRQEAGIGSRMILPLVMGEQCIGEITFVNRADQRAFTQRDANLLMTLASQAATVLQNLRLLEDARRRAVQLQTAAEISRAASSTLDQATLFSETIELIRDRFDYHYIGLFLVDEARKWAVLRAGTGQAGRQQVEAGLRLEVGDQSMVGQAIASGSARIAPAISSKQNNHANPYLPETRSEMVAPLVVRGEAIGALTIQSTVEGAFGEQDSAILQTMADQLANTISNVQLFEQLQQSVMESERLYRRYIRQEWDTQAVAKRAEGRAGYEYDLMQVRPVEPPPADAGENGRGTPTTLTTPLRLGNEVIGTLGIAAESDDYQWSPDEIAIINAVAEQVTQALESAYHSEQSERRAAQMEAASQIGQAVASVLTAEEVIKIATDMISKLFGLHHVAVFLLDESGEFIMLQEATGHAGEIMKESNYRVRASDNTLVSQAIRERQPCIASDVDQQRKWIKNPLLPETRSEMGIPLIASGQLLGVLNIHDTRPAAFDQVDAAVFRTVADQIAATLESARLFEETRQNAAEQQMLFDVTTAAVTTEDLDEMLQRVAETIYRSMGGTDVAVLMVDDENTLRLRAAAGFAALQDAAVQIPVGQGITGWVAQTGEPIIVRDVSSSPRYIMGDSNTRSELAVPIIVDQSVVGVLNIESDELSAFAEKDLRLLQTLSVTLGAIIKNYNLVSELQAANQQLLEVDRLKSQFLANMSHELRTPLNSIIGFSRVILKGIDGPVTDLQTQDLTSIYTSGQHLLGLINNVLDHAKIEAGKMELAPEATHMPEIISGVMSTATGLVKDKPVELQMDIPDNLPPVWADPFRLRQVLLNLVSNAAKFTEEGSITVRAAADPQAVFVQVEDTGVGIGEEDMDKLFQAFSQVDASSTRKVGGSGLGLAISAQFMEMQGGRIWVESTLGEGSTFSIAIPRTNATNDGAIAILAPEPVKAGTRPLPPPEPKDGQLVLSIDDERGVIDLYKRYLAEAGYRVEGATTGREGIERALALADKLAAITIDIVMPDIDGWEIVRQLRHNLTTRRLPIIICSIKLDKEQAARYKVDHYLVKPILQEDLVGALEKCTQQPAGATRRGIGAA